MRMISFFGLTSTSLLLLVALVGVGCGDDGGPTVSTAELFTQGPYEVGYRAMQITYPAAASGEPRTLALRVWYPAQSDSGAEPMIYKVGGVVEIPAPHSLDAPPVTDDGNLPMVVYSHGNGGEGLLAYPNGELMASYGWIVVAPNHTGNTALDLLGGDGDPYARAALNRPNDITAILDEFESGLAGDELAGKADTSKVLLFGHSFGGQTTFEGGGADVDFDALKEGCVGVSSENCDVIGDPMVEAAFRAGFGDSRIVAIAPQAPALGGITQEELAGITVPVMLMTGEIDQTTTFSTSAEPSWAGIDGPNDIWINMPAGGHFSFISICYDLIPAVIDIFQPDATEDGCGPDFIPATDAVPVLAAYIFAFARRHVLGETDWDAILEGPPLGEGFEVTLK